MKKPFVLSLLLFILLVIPACLTTSTVENTPTPIPTPLVSDTTPTSQPAASSLTVCLGQEPNSLYPFGELNSAAQSVLAAIYDGPFDTLSYEYQPAILTQIPSLYLFTIGRQSVFSLTRWSWQIRTRFLVPRTTWDTPGVQRLSLTGLSPSMVALSRALRLISSHPLWSPATPLRLAS